MIDPVLLVLVGEIVKGEDLDGPVTVKQPDRLIRALLERDARCLNTRSLRSRKQFMRLELDNPRAGLPAL